MRGRFLKVSMSDDVAGLIPNGTQPDLETNKTFFGGKDCLKMSSTAPKTISQFPSVPFDNCSDTSMTAVEL